VKVNHIAAESQNNRKILAFIFQALSTVGVPIPLDPNWKSNLLHESLAST